ncbi:MAG: HD domain-containing protein [Eubacterium sp.]|nr:HD domain-containing protein [Eubacterium sp.]
MQEIWLEKGGSFAQKLLDQIGAPFSVETAIYLILFEVSLLLTILYAARWQRNFGVYYTLIFTIIPISFLGQLLLSVANTADEALVGQKIIYLGGCFLIFFITMAIYDLCQISLPKVLKILLLFFNTQIYLSVVTTEYTGLFYRSYTFEKTAFRAVLSKEYRPIHSVFILMIIAYTIMGFFAILYSAFFKKNVSNKRVVLLFFTELISVAAFFIGKSSWLNIDLATVSYIFAQIVFLIIIRRLSIFNVRDTAIDTITRHGEEGFISFDKQRKYIGCFGSAEMVFPELKSIQVDRKAAKNKFLRTEFLPMVETYRNNGIVADRLVERGERIYKLEVHTLYNGKKRSGYQIHITDNTDDQKYIRMMDKFNDYLQDKVDEKTKHIEEMNDNLILSMATMVESRDNSTGGHIRRTSDCVRILTDEMRNDPGLDLDKDFYKSVIKAAPMHDLGKIAVPDAILQKPGKFEDWEFEKMKMHAAEGARIVHEILKNTDDESFKVIAENVAHYHHERWDGSGYPTGLSGEDIPIEARIMAIADVYDALVSKRVYKERMSFEKADSIIMEGMGKHFDASLEKYYVAARPRLEEYYIANDE